MILGISNLKETLIEEVYHETLIILTEDNQELVNDELLKRIRKARELLNLLNQIQRELLTKPTEE